MTRKKISLMVAVLVTAAVSFSFAKELNPLQGGFAPERIQAEVGQTVELTLTIDPLAEFEGVALTLEIPQGLKLLDGRQAEKLFDLKPGAKQTRRFLFRVVETGPQEIWAAAVVGGLPPGIVIRRVYYAVVNPVEPTPYPIKKDKDGREMIVIEAPTTD